DGRPDLFVTNDGEYNFLFQNLGNKFEEVAFQAGVALSEGGAFISGMGNDFRDYNNDGFPDITYVAIKRQTFPLYRNTGKCDYVADPTRSGMRKLSDDKAGFGPALYDIDNYGWKELLVTRGNVVAVWPESERHGQPNTVFRNLGTSGKWEALTEEAGFVQS